MQDAPSALIVAGPTASGKSAAALALAERLGGAVINADAMQVYRDLRVLTARPSPEEEARAPHLLYGYVDGAERYSAGRFVGEAVEAIERCRAEGLMPILCGGTGLYLKALTEGLSPIPEVPAPIQTEAEARWSEDPVRFRDALLQSDPAMTRLDPADRQRHVRAMAVLEATGRPLSSWQEEPPVPPLPGFRFAAAWIALPREELYRRCDLRFRRMLEEGASLEVERLLERGLDPSLPVMKSLGVPELAAMLRGELSPEEAEARAAQQTRRFAKRQTTWFSNQTGWPSFGAPEALKAHFLHQAM
nr:tRNA (adenosine(37)-N6)-dimethylallyltransferase MiaA [Parvularcula maris]